MASAKRTADVDVNPNQTLAELKELRDEMHRDHDARMRALDARELRLDERETSIDDALDRPSREQELTGAVHESYDDDDELEEIGLLDTRHIPARSGMVQRWIRTAIHGEPDMSNVHRKLNQGWQPREADSVPKGAYVPTIVEQRFGDIVGIEGMILMERPEETHAKHARRIERETATQMQAVEMSMFREADPRAVGLGPPKVMQRASTATTGRKAMVADD